MVLEPKYQLGTHYHIGIQNFQRGVNILVQRLEENIETTSTEQDQSLLMAHETPKIDDEHQTFQTWLHQCPSMHNLQR